MKRIIPLSLMAVASLYAAEIQLDTIGVEATKITEVAENAKTSGDVAQALSSKIPSIDMNRRSGIANDIYIRGQKRDNISIEVDGTKVCGACPNRMDPPTSHVLASQIDEIEVIEGPYDVTSFGTLSGGVKIKTKQPTQKLQGELNLGLGSWGYKKAGATVSGGNDIVRILVSGSYENSGQYKDGNGDTMAEQLITQNAPAGSQYQTQYEDMDAYTKKSVMAKAFVTVTDDQELRLSYTQNESDDVLYPNTPMDAIYDDSTIYSAEYNIKNISDIYESINLEYYHSNVDHPMSNQYRKAPASDPTKHTTNHLETTMDGIKLKNSFDIDSYKLLVGLDGSKRTWEGEYYHTLSKASKGISIADTQTNNMALFAKLDRQFGSINLSVGARYDSTEIKSDEVLATSDETYNALNANIFASYNLNRENKIFLGFGQASRVPDARELYFRKTVPGTGSVMYGTPDLDQTTNREIDLGYETNNNLFKLKIKAFYSMLNDYIYYQKSAPTVANKFKNIDATIYGAELSASIYATDDITVDMGAAYKVGEKDEALSGQTDTDLADIAPLRGNLAVNYEYMNNSIATLEAVASDTWDTIDSDNGEQELNSWGIVNAKVKHALNRQFDFTIGINNIFDKAYAQSNTYADLTLITGGGDVTLMNEPGRYFYTNLDFRF